MRDRVRLGDRGCLKRVYKRNCVNTTCEGADALPLRAAAPSLLRQRPNVFAICGHCRQGKHRAVVSNTHRHLARVDPHCHVPRQHLARQHQQRAPAASSVQMRQPRACNVARTHTHRARTLSPGTCTCYSKPHATPSQVPSVLQTYRQGARGTGRGGTGGWMGRGARGDGASGMGHGARGAGQGQGPQRCTKHTAAMSAGTTPTVAAALMIIGSGFPCKQQMDRKPEPFSGSVGCQCFRYAWDI